jgi:hypothetical protein
MAIDDLKLIQERMSSLGNRDAVKALEECANAIKSTLSLLKQGDNARASEYAEMLSQSLFNISKLIRK